MLFEVTCWPLTELAFPLPRPNSFRSLSRSAPLITGWESEGGEEGEGGGRRGGGGVVGWR